MKKNEFIEQVFEIAFGDDAINKEYTFEEVLDRIRYYSDTSLVYENIDEEIIHNTIDTFLQNNTVMTYGELARRIKSFLFNVYEMEVSESYILKVLNGI